MTFRICTVAALLVLTACATAPAHADAFPDQLPPDPARPGWRPPATRAYFSPDARHFDYDPAAGPIPFEDLQDDIWLDPWGTWGPGTASVPLPDPAPVVTPCRPPAAVPGPLPVAGAAAAWGWARRLRRRVG